MHDPIRLGRFLLERRLKGFQIPAAPHFDPDSVEYFMTLLKKAPVYLEYGSGGSTLAAAKYARHMVSVDSDAVYLGSVEKALSRVPSAAERKLIHADIGLTAYWGAPMFRTPRTARVERWKNYPNAPWAYFRQAGIAPDVILVDGRFRAACVLTSLLHLKSGNCTILLDDYRGREHYRAVEAFAAVVTMAGRMAVLRGKPDMDREACAAVLERRYSDWR